MAFYKKCPDCGANLDPSEKCDCQKTETFFHYEMLQHNPSEKNSNDLLQQDLQNGGTVLKYPNTFEEMEALE